MEKQEELNIQPQAGVIGVFSRLNYKAWYAIAEFVDNSTQSFFNHRKELETLEQTCVHIEIHYDDVANTLTITDNAFGMGHDDFLRAVKLDSKPKDQSGRNEFGMGLKTAASWFGDIWCVQSTELGSHTLFSTEVNIPQLRLEEKKLGFYYF